MGIESTSPKIALLRLEVEKEFLKIPNVHNDFVELVDSIASKLKEHISETTLERVWSYSNRGYNTVSLHTLNLLCRYIGKRNWQDFCDSLSELGIIDSEMFEGVTIKSNELKIGDRLQIGWLPDRSCVIEYLGENRFIALECENSTMQPGDTFSCLEFMLNHPAFLQNFNQADENSLKSKRYVAGKVNGLTTIKKL